MRFFDELADGYFKTDDAGAILFYPWGTRGKGVVLPDEENRREAHQTMKRILLVRFLVIIVASFGVGSNQILIPSFTLRIALFVGIFVIVEMCLWLWWRTFIMKFTKGLPATEIRLTRHEYNRTVGINRKIITILLTGAVLLLLLALIGMVIILNLNATMPRR